MLRWALPGLQTTRLRNGSTSTPATGTAAVEEAGVKVCRLPHG
jgi:hypothetical protein